MCGLSTLHLLPSHGLWVKAMWLQIQSAHPLAFGGMKITPLIFLVYIWLHFHTSFLFVVYPTCYYPLTFPYTRSGLPLNTSTLTAPMSLPCTHSTPHLSALCSPVPLLRQTAPRPAGTSILPHSVASWHAVLMVLFSTGESPFLTGTTSSLAPRLPHSPDFSCFSSLLCQLMPGFLALGPRPPPWVLNPSVFIPCSFLGW